MGSLTWSRRSFFAFGALAVFIGVAQLSPVVAVPLAGALGRLEGGGIPAVE
jgi:hypothetical protein